MEIKNIIFDFDGTLLDTTPAILATMRATIDRLNLPQPTDKECLATIGLRLEEIPAALFPSIDNLSVKYASTYRQIFEDVKKHISPNPFPGVIETLKVLHDNKINMAIATSRSSASLIDYLSEMGVSDYFMAMIGGDNVTHGKPDPEPVNKICRLTGWNPLETLVVGDAGVDITMGRAAGCQTCGVTYGNGTVEELVAAKADRLIGDFSELLNYI